MAMCVHEIAAAAIADAMSVIYELTELDPASPLAVRLTNNLYMETACALQDVQEEESYETDRVCPTDYNPEAN